MRTNVLTAGLSDIRGAESNSLLHMYDTAKEVATAPETLRERTWPDRAVWHIAQELRKRDIVR
jgi:hypothetical protein